MVIIADLHNLLTTFFFNHPHSHRHFCKSSHNPHAPPEKVDPPDDPMDNKLGINQPSPETASETALGINNAEFVLHNYSVILL